MSNGGESFFFFIIVLFFSASTPAYIRLMGNFRFFFFYKGNIDVVKCWCFSRKKRQLVDRSRKAQPKRDASGNGYWALCHAGPEKKTFTCQNISLMFFLWWFSGVSGSGWQLDRAWPRQKIGTLFIRLRWWDFVDHSPHIIVGTAAAGHSDNFWAASGRFY